MSGVGYPRYKNLPGREGEDLISFDLEALALPSVEELSERTRGAGVGCPRYKNPLGRGDGELLLSSLEE